MADRRATFPRRDGDGRVAHFSDLLVAAVVALLVAFVVLATFDLVSPLMGLGSPGTSHGWLTAILAVWLYLEDFRAWRGVRSRVPIMMLSVLAGLLVGGGAAYALAQLLPGTPAIVTGSLGAVVACLVYAPAWFFGIRRVE